MIKSEGTSNIYVQFVLSNNQMSGFFDVVDKVKNDMKDKNQQIIIVVPDKFSLNAEQIFMERTGLSSVFNVWITTLSRLVAQVVGEENSLPLLTKNSGIMLVSKIIYDNLDKLSTYKKLAEDYTLAQTMYNAINLLKSSGVRPEEIKSNFGENAFGMKMKDLYVVYSEYEKYMNTHIDTTTRLQIFNQKIKNNEYIKQSKVYFSMFDSFTNVQIESLGYLAKTCKNLSLYLCSNTHQGNKFIYDNTLYQKIKSYFDETGVKHNTTNIISPLEKMPDYLSKNLFSCNQTKTFETNNIKIMECDNIEDEVRYLAGRIKFLVMEGSYAFDDINVSVNGLADYENTVSKIFDEYDLPFYIDSQRTMLNHYFVKTFIKIAGFVCGNNSQSNALAIAKSPVFDIEYQKKCDFDNYCKKYGIFADELYAKFNIDGTELEKNAEEVRSKIFDGIKAFKDSINQASNVSEMSDKCKKYIESLITESKVSENIEEKDIVEKRIDVQAYNKLLNVFDEALNMLGGASISQKMFFDMIENTLGTINLLTVPLKCQAVFVGDASNSTYQPKKVLFVLGATLSRMPSYKTAAGAITDDDIENFVSKKRISPSILELNKREKFKLFNLLLIPSELLELTYSSIINGEMQQKSEFITALQKVITSSGLPITIKKSSLQELEIFDESNQKLPAYLVGTAQNAMIIANSRESKLKYLLHKNFENVLNSQKEKFGDSKERFNVSNTSSYLFPKQKTSISQIESYFKCPFLQFISFAIRPKEQEKLEMKANVVGKILHKVAELFVNQCIEQNFKIDDAKAMAKDIYKDVLDYPDFKDFKANKYFISILESEAIRFCSAIAHQIESSDFKPKYTERDFSDYMLKNGIAFSGTIDRADVCESLNAINIIDYKSGKDKFSFQDIYYGLKLQLLAYLQIASEMFNKNKAGALYMPTKNRFNDINSGEFVSYKLDGVLTDDKGTLMHVDKNLIENQSSEIIPVAFTQKGEINKNSLKHLLSNTEFDEILQYVFDVLTKAVDEMIFGFIEPKPYAKADAPCKFCMYKALCHYEYSQKGFRELLKKDKYSFKKE